MEVAFMMFVKDLWSNGGGTATTAKTAIWNKNSNLILWKVPLISILKKREMDVPIFKTNAEPWTKNELDIF